MKKVIAIALIFVLVVAAGVSGYIFLHGEDGMYSRSVSQTFALSKNALAQWKFEADKDVRAHVKIEIIGASLADQNEAQILIKGNSGNGRKQINAETLREKKDSSMSLPFRKGDNNYIIFTPVKCSTVQLKVTVTTYTLKGHIRTLGVESGKDYSL